MNKLLYILIFPLIINAQDIAGTYKMTGIYTLWQQITRGTTDITISDIHGLGLTLPVSTIPPGQAIGWYGLEPIGEPILNALGLSLYVTFNEDGTGTATGLYPIAGTNQYDFGCITSLQMLPALTNFLYQSNLNSGSEIPYNSIVGPLSYQSPFMGETVGNIGLSNSDFFPNLPLNPFNPTLCDGSGSCIDLDLSSSGGDIIVGGDPLPGVTGAYVLKGDPVLPSFLQDQGNEYSNLYIEYITIDGGYSGYGLGEIVGEDEDGDGTDFDRLGSIPYLIVTYVSPSPGCGFNYPIFGDVTSLLESEDLGDCIIEVDSGDMGYVMNLDLANWGYFVTFNAVMYVSTEDPAYLIDDSDHDYNGIDGRMIMEFSPTCVLVIDNFHGMWEFIEVGDCDNIGDLNGDILYNVLDIVVLVGCILSDNCEDEPNACAADVNADGGYNVVDVVVLVNCILAGNCEGL